MGVRNFFLTCCAVEPIIVTPPFNLPRFGTVRPSLQLSSSGYATPPHRQML
jgi:hypothetical protein